MPDLTTTPIDEGAYCANCGYDLRAAAAAADRCPECGLRADDLQLQLPWERRREIGRVPAFLRTARLATGRPGRLARGVARQVDARSARQFRRVVLVVAAVAVTLAFVVVVRRVGGPEMLDLQPDPVRGVVATNAPALFWSAGAMFWPVLPLGLLLTLWVGTRWDHWFVLRQLSPARRNRTMAAARYTVAPLLGLVPVAALAALTTGVGPDDWLSTSQPYGKLAWLALILTSAATVLLVATGPARYAAAVPAGGWGRAAAVLVGTAVQWVVATAVGLALFPAILGLLWVMIDSLR